VKARVKILERKVKAMHSKIDYDAFMEKFIAAFDNEDWETFFEMLPKMREMNLNQNNRRG
jgi:hypothetical protein